MGSRRSVILLAIGLMLLCVSGHVGPIAAAPAVGLNASNPNYMPFVGPAPYHGVEVFGPGGQALGHVLPTIVPDVLAVAPNGVCYELGSGTLTAVSSQRTMLWQQPNYADAVLIGQQGTVYTAGGNRVDAYAPSGHLLWQRTMPDAITTLGERGDGTLLAVGVSGISAVRPTGQVVWHAPLGSAKAGASSSAPTLAIDAHGRAYIGGADGTVRAITPSGAVLWAQRAGGATPFGATPAVVLGPHGTLAIAGTDGQVAVYQ